MRAYLELLRPANVVTALADVVAGSAAAYSVSHVPSGWLLLSTACLYGGGVVLNDFFDRRLDATERPERPIPSGRVAPGVAAAIGFGLLGVGMLSARMASPSAALVAAAIAVLVIAYDAWLKPGLFGPLVMGACRGLNLLLGMAGAAGIIERRWPLALLSFFLILAVTIVSRGEVHGASRQPGALALGLVAVVVGGLVIVSVHVRPSYLALATTALFGWIVFPPFTAAWQRPDAATIRAAVREGILSLMILDAAIAVAFAGPLLAAVVVALALLARRLSQAFAVT